MNEQTISHLYQRKKDGKWIIQSNEEHQRGVAEMAASYAEQFGLPSWGYLLGLIHDKGKERVAFQQYIRKVNNLSTDDNNQYSNHNHAFVGGLLAKEFMGPTTINLLSNQIISHHTGLHDYNDLEDILNNESIPKEINKDNIKIEQSLLINELMVLDVLKSKEGKKLFHHLSRMLFSCLVDADRLDTERFMDEQSWQQRRHSTPIATLLPKLETYIRMLQSSSADTEVNRIRQKIQEQCRMMSSKEKGFYSLTVPTGGGKTLSSLLWAMTHAVRHSMNRIVIAIPYTSIIVQTARLLKKIFGEENVLEHHSIFNPDDVKNNEVREKSILATENWDYPIIITTNVQLFESLFANKPSVCRKLHNIVNSVIILDEVQMLPTDFLLPIVDALKAYQKLFGVSVLFTTASQPVLCGKIKGARSELNGIDNITEIIPNEFALHNKLRRVIIDFDDSGKTYEEIVAKVSQYNKVLCIVNTRKDAKELYDRLPDEGVKIHLSRMMCPAHVGDAIEVIKRLLQDSAQPIVRVIATQLIEAGVDIDFPVVFRQEAGLDSILQAAGRCNREGKLEMGHAFVFSLSAEGRIPFGSIARANNARKNLLKDSDWFSPVTMDRYFRQLYVRVNTFDKKNINSYLGKPTELSFETAAKEFKLIDDNGVNIIVNWGNSMELVEELKESGCAYHLMKQLSKFTVNVHRSDFCQLVSNGFIEEILEGIYVLSDKAQYDKATGLSLDNHWMEEVLMI